MTSAPGRILVTGGAGFIGTHVVATLRAHGRALVVLDSLRSDVHAGAPPELPELVVGDVRDPAAVRGALDGVDAVIHLAGKVGLGVDVGDLPDYADSNVHGTGVLLAEMARAGVRRLVLASSMVVYGEGLGQCPRHGAVRPGPRAEADLRAGSFEAPCPRCHEWLAPCLVGEDTAADPRNGYAATKLAQEHLALAWARSVDGSVAALRYHNVYGPGMPRDTPYSGVAAIFRSQLRAGNAARVFEDGNQRRDFVHVSDVAAATVAALGHDDRFRAYNVGSGTPRTVGDMARALTVALDGPPVQITGQYRLGDVRHIAADSGRARRELGWEPRVDFTDGVAALAAAH